MKLRGKNYRTVTEIVDFINDCDPRRGIGSSSFSVLTDDEQVRLSKHKSNRVRWHLAHYGLKCAGLTSDEAILRLLEDGNRHTRDWIAYKYFDDKTVKIDW